MQNNNVTKLPSLMIEQQRKVFGEIGNQLESVVGDFRTSMEFIYEIDGHVDTKGEAVRRIYTIARLLEALTDDVTKVANFAFEVRDGKKDIRLY